MSEKEQKVINILKQVDIPKDEAKFLFYLFNNDKVSARDIEIGADLRQPEVSNAAKWLTDKKLIKFSPIEKTGGKGRPLFEYSLVKSKEKTIESIDDMFMNRIHLLESDMEKFSDILHRLKPVASKRLSHG